AGGGQFLERKPFSLSPGCARRALPYQRPSGGCLSRATGQPASSLEVPHVATRSPTRSSHLLEGRTPRSRSAAAAVELAAFPADAVAGAGRATLLRFRSWRSPSPTGSPASSAMPISPAPPRSGACRRPTTLRRGPTGWRPAGAGTGAGRAAPLSLESERDAHERPGTASPQPVR